MARERSLALLAGPDAMAILRERGLRAEDVDVVPGASGGPKWLVLEGLDRFLFGELLILAPTADFVARLPGGKIPDRNDFYRMPDTEREAAWRKVVAASQELADELRELLASGRIAEAVRPL